MLQKGIVGLWVIAAIVACKTDPGQTKEQAQTTPATNVKVTGITIRDIQENERFPATVVYLDKSNLNASHSGYLTQVYVAPADYVRQGDPLFQVETREHSAIKGDTSLQKAGIDEMGIFTLQAPASGYISNLMQQQGDFVQEGTAICSFTRDDQIYVKAFLPVDRQDIIYPGKPCKILLSDSARLKATVARTLNELDPASQALQVLVRPTRNQHLAENLNLQVELTLQREENAQVVPSRAVLSNEKLDHFWVMKMVDDSTAIKVPVTTGIRQSDSIQIKSPVFKDSARLITEGNYGLPDTAKVKVIPAP